MILKSRNQTPAEMRATIEALEQIVNMYEDEIETCENALITAHLSLNHIISVIAYTKNQPDQVDFDGILMRLADIRDTVQIPLGKKP